MINDQTLGLGRPREFRGGYIRRRTCLTISESNRRATIMQRNSENSPRRREACTAGNTGPAADPGPEREGVAGTCKIPGRVTSPPSCPWRPRVEGLHFRKDERWSHLPASSTHKGSPGHGPAGAGVTSGQGLRGRRRVSTSYIVNALQVIYTVCVMHALCNILRIWFTLYKS